MGRVNREKRELSERGDGAGFDRRWTQMDADGRRWGLGRGAGGWMPRGG